MFLILARHGETVANNDDLLQGQLDGVLSERGWLQAEALASALKDERLDVIYSSDLKRGSDTAGVIAKYHDLPVAATVDARERNFGVYAGTNRTEFYARERAMDDPYSNRPQGGESFKDLYERARSFVMRLYDEHPGKTVLLVAHGDYARMCLGVLQGKTVNEACQIRQSNACINRVEVTSGLKGRVLLQDFVDHLPDELKSNNKSAL